MEYILNKMNTRQLKEVYFIMNNRHTTFNKRAIILSLLKPLKPVKPMKPVVNKELPDDILHIIIKLTKKKKDLLNLILVNKKSKESVFREIIRRKNMYGNAWLRTAVKDYLRNPVEAEEKYGPITDWDTQWVDDMSNLFKNAHTFNGDISTWDVSNVRNMKNMFLNARSFNRDLSSWNVGNVRNMQKMFSRAHEFNGKISNWDFKNLEDARYMLQDINVFTVSVRDRPIEITELIENIIQKIKDDRENAGKPEADTRAIIPNYYINVIDRDDY